GPLPDSPLPEKNRKRDRERERERQECAGARRPRFPLIIHLAFSLFSPPFLHQSELPPLQCVASDPHASPSSSSAWSPSPPARPPLPPLEAPAPTAASGAPSCRRCSGATWSRASSQLSGSSGGWFRPRRARPSRTPAGRSPRRRRCPARRRPPARSRCARAGRRSLRAAPSSPTARGWRASAARSPATAGPPSPSTTTSPSPPASALRTSRRTSLNERRWKSTGGSRTAAGCSCGTPRRAAPE
ncbi:MAG: hypothetical protein BJ554DRAFT_7195, partial [Olpidium bornovanus]